MALVAFVLMLGLIAAAVMVAIMFGTIGLLSHERNEALALAERFAAEAEAAHARAADLQSRLTRRKKPLELTR